jgi:hypothetical protein
VFWEIFVVADSLMGGYVFTGMHWLFVLLQVAAATGTQERAAYASR